MASPYVFDLELFREVFPVVPVGDDLAQLGGVCSPSCLVEIEALRAKLGEVVTNADQRPVDVFTWAIGEPPDRHVTKIGGVPYRPSALPWPRSSNGAPKAFLAQFSFSGTVLAGVPLPGTTVLVFVDDVLSDDWTEDSFYLEWQAASIPNLIAASNVPPPRINIPVLYGVRHRSTDLLGPLPEGSLSGVVGSYQLEFQSPSEVARELACFDATKIGGVPSIPLKAEANDHLLLFSLISMYPRPGVRFPYVNREEPYLLLSGAPVLAPGNGYFHIAVTRDNNGRFSVHYQLTYC